MPVPDTELVQWNTDSTLCSPADSDLIAGNLPGQIRNLKSVFRGHTLEKQWIRRGSGVATYVSATSFTVLGDQTTFYQINRWLRVWSTTAYSIQWVTGTTYDGGTNITTVNVIPRSGLPLSDPIVELDSSSTGMRERPTPDRGDSGSITIADAATSGVATFGFPPMENYWLYTAMVITATPGAAALSKVVWKVDTPTTTGFTIHIAAAPIVGESVVVGWSAMRPIYG
jgi:hypothetical protein